MDKVARGSILSGYEPSERLLVHVGVKKWVDITGSATEVTCRSDAQNYEMIASSSSGVTSKKKFTHGLYIITNS